MDETVTGSSALATYDTELRASAELCRREPFEASPQEGFHPGFELPPLDPSLARFYAASTIRVVELGSHDGHRIRLLDLMGNPRTRTTKTFASLTMVARAVRFIRETGESILLVTPTSANKGGALRDAVARAIENELVSPEALRIAIVVPRDGIDKLWSSPLSDDPQLRRLNPVFVAETSDGRVVKDITRTFVREQAPLLREERGINVWHTYALDNYRLADAVRAFVEADRIGPPESGRSRVHAHAVSSAFGLLGYHHGRRVLAEAFGRECGPHPHWLLVQHLGTPDLVLNQLFGSFSRENMPAYERDVVTGSFVQERHPSFPRATFDPREVIDSTFYSHAPATAPAVKAIMERQGGAGIVVSLQECLARYPSLRRMLEKDGPRLPADPRDVREWSLVMVLTGVLEALERELLPPGSEVIVHGSGSYSVGDYVPLPRELTTPVSTANDMLPAVLGAEVAVA